MRVELQIDRTPMAWIVRLILLSGVVAIVAAALHISLNGEPWWLADPIYVSCLVAGIAVGLVAIASEILFATTRWIGWRVWMLFVALAVIVCPWLHVFPAALYGRDIADESTWHLLPLFAFIKVVTPVFFVGGLSGLIVFVAFFFRMVQKT